MYGQTNMRIPYEWNTFKAFNPFNRFARFKPFRRFQL